MVITTSLGQTRLHPVQGEENYTARLAERPLSLHEKEEIEKNCDFLGVTKNFREIIDYFNVPEGETPAGFRIEYIVEDRVLRADLVRDISYEKNGVKRPTNLLFSADSANPYEIEPIKDFIANLTCNPGIIYDLFINNPKANVGGKFKTRDEVMAEIGRILGPGCDISVELNDPFGKTDEEILEEAEKFRELLSPYRVVIKVPHTGPVNAENVQELLNGDKKLSTRYDSPSTKDAFRGHQIAQMLHEHGFRVNFTLMFEPWQSALALQAHPYFINSFIRHRLIQTKDLYALLEQLDLPETAEKIRSYMIEKDYLTKADQDMPIDEVIARAKEIVSLRQYDPDTQSDGLDGVRQNLRLLRETNLPDSRLIICSMEGGLNYPEIDRLLSSEEYADMAGRVVLTAEPGYLARFTSANQVISYQRRFMNAANGQK